MFFMLPVFLDEILQLQEALGIERPQLLLMAREVAHDARLRGLHELRPTCLYALLLLLEQIKGTSGLRDALMRKCANVVS